MAWQTNSRNSTFNGGYLAMGKGKFVFVLTLSTTPRRRMGKWMYRSRYSWIRQSTSRPDTLSPGKDPSAHWKGDWVGLRAGPHEMEKWKSLTLPEFEFRPLGHPARSHYCTLYRAPHIFTVSMVGLSLRLRIVKCAQNGFRPKMELGL
jgi:hypothetical protein